jgi:hypothetical protein
MQLEMELRDLYTRGIITREGIANLVKNLAQLEPKEKRSHAPHVKGQGCGAVTTYTTVIRHYTCQHCGGKFDSSLSLGKEDSIPALLANGKVMIITSKSPLEIECATGHCGRCNNFISQLSREELEQRYLTLLRKESFLSYNRKED